MAGRKAAAALLVLALLVVAGGGAAGECGVDQGKVLGACSSYCRDGGDKDACCAALKHADFKCLCDKYWNKLKSSPFATCAKAIPSNCGINNAPPCA